MGAKRRDAGPSPASDPSAQLVQIRTRVKNELQHLMLNQGTQKKQKLWSAEGRAALASLPLEPRTDRRRHDLLHLLSMLDGQLEDLNEAVTQVARQYPDVGLLMSQLGVGAVTALAFCPDCWRCSTLPTWQAGRQLPGPDSS